MPSFYFRISDGKTAEITSEADNAHSAVNDGITALAAFAFKHFPPPENISISISDANRNPVATLSLAFTIEYAQGLRPV